MFLELAKYCYDPHAEERRSISNHQPDLRHIPEDDQRPGHVTARQRAWYDTARQRAPGHLSLD